MIHGFRGRHDLPSLLRAKSLILCRCGGDATCETALVGASPPPLRLDDHGSVVFRVKKRNPIGTDRGKLTARQGV